MSFHIFISYPRVADGRGAVSDLRAHLERELQLKTGDKELVVFQDQSHIAGGDPWSKTLEDELKVANAFLLLLSPLWLTSELCCKEFQLFRDVSNEKGIDRPIIPLLWDETERSDARTDEQAQILEIVMAKQLVKWDVLRHQNSSYPGYFAAIGDLAKLVKRKLRGQ